jgi:hypothetical protein
MRKKLPHSDSTWKKLGQELFSGLREETEEQIEFYYFVCIWDRLKDLELQDVERGLERRIRGA